MIKAKKLIEVTISIRAQSIGLYSIKSYLFVFIKSRNKLATSLKNTFQPINNRSNTMLMNCVWDTPIYRSISVRQSTNVEQRDKKYL